MKKEAQLHFERAAECTEDAELLLEKSRYASAVGRAYYAMFHAATAVLLDKEIERSSHSGIIAAFGEFLVKPNLIEQKYHQHFREIFDLRQESDYQPIVDIDSKQAEQTVERAKGFVMACRKLCG